MTDLKHISKLLTYTELISGINGKNIKLENVHTNKNEKIFCLRHDIDNLDWFDLSLKMAQLEYSNNIRSTYCVISSDKKFFSRDTIYNCNNLIDLGHSINLHLNIIGEYLKTKKKIKDIINKYLSFLRVNNIEVLGVSAHGSPENYIYGFNYEFWKEFDPTKFQGMNKLDFDKVALSDFNLIYDTTLIGHDVYLSDRRESFMGYFLKDFNVVPFDTIAYKSKHNKGLKIIEEFNKMKKGFFQMNIHPHPKRWKN